MKKILTVIAGMILAIGMLQAVPAKRGWLTMEQPDGTSIEVQLIGDEYYHYAINRDGKRVKQNEEGWWIEAGEVPSAEVAKARHDAAKARKSARRAPQAVGTEPNLAPKGVVILVNFKDDAMQSSHTQAVFDELCNSTNCTVNKYNNKNYGSAAQYFADQSNGSYRPQFDVYGPVTLSRNVAYYGTDKDTGDPEEDEGDDQYATDAVAEACILANQQYSGLNFADYDSDSDGYVDFVYVIYAGKGQADGGAATTIWPHNWSVQSAITSGYCTYTKAQCTIDGKKLDNYAMSGELSGSSLGGIGTLCHEFGHVMGLPDLYDTEYGTNYKNGVTPGDWNIMDGGSYNGDGHCPPNYDPWQKYFFGWVTPVNLATDGKNITLYPNGTEGYQSYQINSANQLQTATTAGVNYYIENRQKQGWDAFVPTSGMLVCKINFNSSAWSDNTPNNTAGSPKYTIVPADGKTSDYGAAGDTYPYGSSVRSYTPISGHALTEITKSGSNITFKYNGGQQKTECSYELLGEHCTYPADGVVAYNAALSLTITPEAGYTLADPSCWTVEMGTNNELVYGEGFTYNAGTNEFRIEKVTDDVAIMAEGKAQVTLTWMANGVQFAQTITAGSVVLPENEPEGCEGKVFVGWTTEAVYEDASVAPAFVKTGDEASQTTFYAVFATQGEGGSETIEKASSVAVGDEVILVYESDKKELSGIGGGNTKYGEGVAYTTTPAGVYLLEVVAGSTNGTYALKHGNDYLQWTSGNSLDVKTSIDANSSWTITFSGGDATIKNASDDSRVIQWNANSPRFACYTSTQKAIQLYKKAGGGASYSDYTTSCVPLEKYAITINQAANGSLSTSPSNEAVAGKTVTITATPTAHYHLATLLVKDADAANVAVSGTGNTRTFTMPEKAVTITATFAEDDKYTVRFLNNGVVISTKDYYLGETASQPANPTPECDKYTFAGWWTAELAEDNREAKSWVNNFTVNGAQDYYAIYSKTVKSGVPSNNYEKISTMDELTNGNYVLTGNNARAMKGELLSNYYLATTSVSPSANKISNPTASIVWEISREGNNVSFYNANAGKYVYMYQAGTYYDLGLRNTADVFNASVNNGNWTFESNTYSGRYLIYMIYKSTTHEFAAGASTSTTLQLYKQTDEQVVYYTSVEACTSTVIEVVETNEPAAVKIIHNGQIVIRRGETIYTITGTRIE